MKIARGNPWWVPANEIRGEGIFFQFSETEIQNWLGRVQRLHLEFFNAHKEWRKDRGLQPPEDFYPGLRYVLLHSFAHALIRQLSYVWGEIGVRAPPVAGISSVFQGLLSDARRAF